MFEDPETLCRELLAPYAMSLRAIPRDAWRRYQALPIESRVALDRFPIARANVMFANMIDISLDSLAAMPGVQAVETPHSMQFLLQGQVLVRLKCIDHEGLSSNYPTTRARRFNANLSLEGIPAQALRVDVGYRLDPLGQFISSVDVVRRQRNRVLWRFSLDQPVEALVIPIQPALDQHLKPLPKMLPKRTGDTGAARKASGDEA